VYFGTGQPDIRALQPNRMYRNAGTGRSFQDVTTSGNFGHLQKGHGIAFADLDNDGDMDVYGQMGGAFFGDYFHDAVYLNPGHGNAFVKMQLVGIETNRFALGSRVYVYTIDAQGARRMHHHFVSTGGSYGSNALEVHVGLGQAVSIEKIVVWWQKTGLKQEVLGVPLNSKVVVTEGAEAFAPFSQSSFVVDTTALDQHNAPMTCH